MNDKVSIRLEDVNFWKDFIEESRKEGLTVHPKMQEKLLEAEEQLMLSLLEKHSIDKVLLLNTTIH